MASYDVKVLWTTPTGEFMEVEDTGFSCPLNFDGPNETLDAIIEDVTGDPYWEDRERYEGDANVNRYTVAYVRNRTTGDVIVDNRIELGLR